MAFDDLARAASARGEVALGFRCGGPDGAGLELNPDRDARWTLTAGDEVVVLRSTQEASPAQS